MRAYLREALPQFERLAALEALTPRRRTTQPSKSSQRSRPSSTMAGWQPEQQVEAVLSQLAYRRAWAHYRRLAPARGPGPALVTKPELLLLDEPTTLTWPPSPGSRCSRLLRYRGLYYARSRLPGALRHTHCGNRSWRSAKPGGWRLSAAKGAGAGRRGSGRSAF